MGYRCTVLDDIGGGPVTDHLVVRSGPQRIGTSVTLLQVIERGNPIPVRRHHPEDPKRIRGRRFPAVLGSVRVGRWRRRGDRARNGTVELVGESPGRADAAGRFIEPGVGDVDEELLGVIWSSPFPVRSARPVRMMPLGTGARDPGEDRAWQ
jgi:hypothetical protein